jgi:hypothetical protein
MRCSSAFERSLGSLYREERIVFSPDNQHSRLLVTEVFVPDVVERHVRLVVGGEVRQPLSLLS